MASKEAVIRRYYTLLVRQRIKYRRLLKVDQAKSAGPWRRWPTHWAGGGAANTWDGERCPWVCAASGPPLLRVNPRGIYTNPEPMANLLFVEEAANNAAHGWRIVITHIDQWLPKLKPGRRVTKGELEQVRELLKDLGVPT